jgi:hypothetical protein
MVVLEIDGDAVPEASGDGETIDKMQMAMTSSKVCKVASISSCDALEGRLEVGSGVGASGSRLRQGPAEDLFGRCC